MPEFWAKRETGYLTTRDGRKLHYSVLLPKEAASKKVPVILSINGYDAGSIGSTAYRKYRTAMSVDLDKRLIEQGYAVMGVSVAGTGCSQGTMTTIGKKLGEDGADAVEFAALRNWSDGNVGMINWSWGGASQVATAEQQPKHLRAIAPGNVYMDLAGDMMKPGGVPQPGFMNLWRYMISIYWGFVADTAKEENDSACLKQLEVNRNQEPATSPLQKLLAGSVQNQDRNYELLQDVDKIKVPVLSIESFQDQSTSVRGGNYQNRLDPNNYWLVQTNGHHDVYLSFEYHKTVLKFLDRFVKGEKNGFEQSQPQTTIWMDTYATGTDLLSSFTSTVPGWKVEKARISEKDLQVKEFHLGSGGVLGNKTTGGAADPFDYSPKGVSVGSFEGSTSWGELPTDWKQQSLAYTSQPLDSDALVYGSGSADLWLVTNAGDADVQVTVTEVRPDGQEVYVQRGWLRMSGRKLDESLSTPLLPVRTNKPEDVRPLDPAQAVLGRVEILKMGHFFRKGSRLRVWIDTPSDTGGYSFDTYAQQQKVYVLHNEKYDSKIRLGILPDVKGPADYPKCGVVLSQPCRPDPLAAK